MRRDDPPPGPEVSVLTEVLEHGGLVFTTGLVLQELLQCFRSPAAREAIIHRFASLPFLIPTRANYIEATQIRNECSPNT